MLYVFAIGLRSSMAQDSKMAYFRVLPKFTDLAEDQLYVRYSGSRFSHSACNSRMVAVLGSSNFGLLELHLGVSGSRLSRRIIRHPLKSIMIFGHYLPEGH